MGHYPGVRIKRHNPISREYILSSRKKREMAMVNNKQAQLKKLQETKDSYVKHHDKDVYDAKVNKVLDMLQCASVEDELDVLSDTNRGNSDDDNDGVGGESKLSNVNAPVVEDM